MKFGLTNPFSCSYLPDKQEQLLVLVEEPVYGNHHYDMLISAGFRRSGEQIYRPHCRNCQACHSVRLPVADFTPSRSQKRVLNKNKDIRVLISRDDKPEYYPLYEQYINQRHQDGSMYPASRQQYRGFIQSAWSEPLFVECYMQRELVAVAVTDVIQHGLSALYTFFKPELVERSIGTFSILQQIKQTQKMQLSYLYLGYQVDACAKMNYKTRFYPHERFFENKWHRVQKKPA